MAETEFPYIPWHTNELWEAVNDSFNFTLDCYNGCWTQAKEQAGQLEAALRAVAFQMDELCGVTCPNCTDVCCLRARVWFDFSDLLFLHLTGMPIPAGQLIRHRHEQCRFAQADGCRLDRIQRPFICTRYLCPAQTRILRHSIHGIEPIREQLNDIKQMRLSLENLFVQTVMTD